MPKKQTFEQGDLPLDTALTLFERGVALLRDCNGLLDAAELKITKLVQLPDGSIDEQAFDLQAGGQ